MKTSLMLAQRACGVFAVVLLVTLTAGCEIEMTGVPGQPGGPGGGDDVTPPGTPPVVGAGAVAYRVSSLTLLDPHIYADVGLLGCNDVTEQAPFGMAGVNQQIEASLNDDTLDTAGNQGADGLLDASMVVRLESYDPSAASTATTLSPANCTAPVATTSCSLAGAPVNVSAANSQSGVCGSIPAGVTNPTYGTPQLASAPCAALGPFDLPLNDLLQVPITLRNTQISSAYVGDGGVLRGLLYGEVLASEAQSSTVDFGLGPQTVASLLPGGQGSCAPGNDADQTSGGPGWYFFLRFEAQTVTLVQ